MNAFIQKIGLLTVAIILGFGETQAQTPQKWEIDKSHASVNFSVNHFFSTVTGKFKKFDGEFYFDANNLAESKITFTVFVKSVDTDEDERDEHLQSKDFFNAPVHPTMQFVSTKIERKNDKEYILHGNLTIRGTTKTVALPMKIKGIMDNPWQEEKVIMGIAIHTTLDRTDYGVGTGSWAATAIVGDEVTVDVHMELDELKARL